MYNVWLPFRRNFKDADLWEYPILTQRIFYPCCPAKQKDRRYLWHIIRMLKWLHNQVQMSKLTLHPRALACDPRVTTHCLMANLVATTSINTTKLTPTRKASDQPKSQNSSFPPKLDLVRVFPENLPNRYFPRITGFLNLAEKQNRLSNLNSALGKCMSYTSDTLMKSTRGCQARYLTR